MSYYTKGELQSGSYYGPTYVRKGVQHYGQLPLDEGKRQRSLAYYKKQEDAKAAANKADKGAKDKAIEDAEALKEEAALREAEMAAARDAKLIENAKFGDFTGAQWMERYAELQKKYTDQGTELGTAKTELGTASQSLSDLRLGFDDYKAKFNQQARDTALSTALSTQATQLQTQQQQALDALRMQLDEDKGTALGEQRTQMLSDRQAQLDILRDSLKAESAAELSKAQTISGSRIQTLEDQLAAQTNKYVDQTKANELLAGKNQEFQQKYADLTALSKKQQSDFALQMSDANTEFAKKLQSELSAQRGTFDAQLTGFQSEADRKMTEALQASKADYTERLAMQQRGFEGQLADQKQGYEARVGDLQGNLSTLQEQLGASQSAFDAFKEASAETLAKERLTSANAAAEMQARLDSLRVRAQTPQTVGSGPTKDAYGVQLQNKQAVSKRGLSSLRKNFDPKALLNLAGGANLGSI